MRFLFVIIIALALVIVFLASLMLFVFVQEEAKASPKKTFEILDISVDGNAITLHNTGTASLSFSEVEVFVNEQTATVVNKEVILHPDEIAVLIFATPVFGENLEILIKGPDNEFSFTAGIIESGLPTVCLDNICSDGENCPSDAVSCQDRTCFIPTCIDGCGEIPVPYGEQDTECTGDLFCDGSGNCINPAQVNGGNGGPGNGGGSGGGSSGGSSGGNEETVETCSDVIQNQNETDVDCGGFCPGCPDNAACVIDSDCFSGNCVGGVCIGGGAVCGDGNIESGEQCDDGNTEDGDGCSSSCLLEIQGGFFFDDYVTMDFVDQVTINNVSFSNGQVAPTQQFVGEDVADAGTRLLMHMNDGAVGDGQIVMDNSGNEINGTINGNVDCTFSGLFGTDGCHFNSSSGSYINLENPLRLSHIEESQPYSLSLWLKSDDGGFSKLLFGRKRIPQESSLRIGFGISNQGRFYSKNGDGVSSLECSTPIVQAGEWVHLVYSNNGSWGKLYFNGSECDSASAAPNIDFGPNSLWVIGSSSGSYAFEGIIEEVQIWDRALSDQEVSDLYNGISYTGSFESTLINMGGSFNSLNLFLNESILGNTQVSITTDGGTTWTPIRNNAGILYATSPLVLPASTFSYRINFSSQSSVDDINISWTNVDCDGPGNSFSFATFSDTYSGQESGLAQVLQEMFLVDPDVRFITTGGDTPSYERVRGVIDDSLYQVANCVPYVSWFPTPGNHDSENQESMDWWANNWATNWDTDPTTSRIALQLPDLSNFRRGPLSLPGFGNVDYGTIYSFDYKNAHFIILNSYARDIIGDSDAGVWDVNGGVFDPETSQLDWVEQDLQLNMKPVIFVFIHVAALAPVYNFSAPPAGWNEHNSNFHTVNLSRLLADYNVTALYHGHDHVPSRRLINRSRESLFDRLYWDVFIDPNRPYGTPAEWEGLQGPGSFWQIDAGKVYTNPPSDFVITKVNDTHVTFEIYHAEPPGPQVLELWDTWSIPITAQPGGPVCGNGVKEGIEECDGVDFGANDGTCYDYDLQYGSGNLTCNDCTINTGSCSAGICGDGFLNPGEQCDDGGTIPGDGCNSICQQETCAEQGGFICGPSESCPRSILPASDTNSCCDVACELIQGASYFVDQNPGQDCIGTYDIAARACGGSTGITSYDTFLEAADASNPGDNISIRDGTYTETLIPRNSGVPGFPIRFSNYNNEEVIIENTPWLGSLISDYPPEESNAAQDNYGIYIYEKRYVEIEGLKINSVEAWLRSRHSHHLKISNDTFTIATLHGASAGLKFINSSNNTLVNNTIYDGNDNILFIDSDYNIIEGNNISKGRHGILEIKCGNFNVVRNNYFHNDDQKIGEIFDCDSTQQEDTPDKFNATKRNVIEKNVFASTAPDDGGGPYNHIQYAGQNGIIRNNLFYDSQGIALSLARYSNEADYNLQNRIYHNVFYNNTGGGVWTSSATIDPLHFNDNILVNNIYYLGTQLPVGWADDWPSGSQLTHRSLGGFELKYNNIINETAGEDNLIWIGYNNRQNLSYVEENYPNLYKNNLEVNPQFIDVVNHDFHLSGASQMIDNGTFLSRTVGSGTNSNVMVVEDAGYFYDGYGIAGQVGDIIQLEGQSQTARIVDIDYISNTLILDTSLSWSSGLGISLEYSGNAPDIGAFEFS